MKIFVLLIILFLPLITKAQNCVVDNDYYTGKKVKMGIVALTPGETNTVPSIKFKKQDNSFFISFDFFVEIKATSFDKEKMLMFVKFENGVIKKYQADSKSIIAEIPTGCLVNIVDIISTDDLFYFKNSPVSSIGASYKGNDDEGYNIKLLKIKAQAIKKSVDCVLN